VKFEVASVAEDSYQSDRLTAKAESHFPNRQTLKLSFTAKGNMIVEASCPTNQSIPVTTIVAFDVDVDSLLQFIQDAKIFIEEEKVIAKLIGK
jgi:hypothetical protein